MKAEITYRSYNQELDEKAVIRIWKECGWLDLKKNRKTREAFRRWVACEQADVAVFRDSAECLVTTHRGSITMLDEELPFRAVSCVTVGRPLRRLGGAGELTARAVARAAQEGDAVAGLGIFDQGFYNKLGFGNFPYSRHISFDPLTLNVPHLSRPPVRLTRKDLSRISTNIAERRKHHGLVKFHNEEFFELVMAEEAESFGLGFEDESGRLTHHLWAIPKGESGPYRVLWLIYRDYSGLLELLSLLKNLGDQVNTFIVHEPWGVQFQDLLSRPFRNQEISGGSEYKSRIQTVSYKQARILDLKKVLAALKLPGGRVHFNLDLHDPIGRYLPEDAEWRGLTGRWTIELREDGSTATEGWSEGLPLMKASINALTRLIFGVATPEGLAFTDDLEAPSELLSDLASKLRLPVPDMEQIF